MHLCIVYKKGRVTFAKKIVPRVPCVLKPPMCSAAVSYAGFDLRRGLHNACEKSFENVRFAYERVSSSWYDPVPLTGIKI